MTKKGNPVVIGGLSPPGHLDTIGHPDDLNSRWKSWKSQLQIFITASGITNAEQKHAILLLTGGEQLSEIWQNFSEDEKAVNDDEDSYTKAIELLNKHFELKENIPKSRLKFWELSPDSGETINNFITRLKSQAKHCRFNDDADDHVTTKVLIHIQDRDLKAKLLRDDNLNLEALIKTVGNYHNKEALILNRDSNILRTTQKKSTTDNRQTKPTCTRCGIIGHYSRECIKSRDHLCTICKRTGHFEAQCFFKNEPRGRTSPKRNHKNIQNRIEEKPGETDTNSDD